MSHSRASRNTSVNSSLLSKLDAFLASSYSTYNSKKESPEEWSRAQSRAFYHTLKTPVEFVAIYSHCLKYLETHASAKAPVQKKAPLVKKEVVFAEDGACTDAEFSQGRSQLNAILNREYSLWWDAFVDEENEDYEKDAMSADDRFALHCGKMLASKTGIPLEMTASVVNGWLIEKHA